MEKLDTGPDEWKRKEKKAAVNKKAKDPTKKADKMLRFNIREKQNVEIKNLMARVKQL